MNDRAKCWFCGKEIDLIDNYCRHCGKSLHEKGKFQYKIEGIFALYLLIGPLCIVNLIKSPLIKKEDKYWAGAVIIALTIGLIWLAFYLLSIIVKYYMAIFTI